jgi:hypothetical protein
MRTLEDIIKETEEQRFQRGNLVPACGGTEKPFTTKGYRLLYCYHTGNGNHYYLNLDTDMILTDEEVKAIFLS